MKKIRVFIGALFALAVVSCTMEDNFQNVKLEEMEVTIEAIREVDDIETRTYRDDSDGSILWVPGDAISLFYGSGSNGGSKFTSVNTTDTTKVTNFTGVITAITGGGEVAVDQTYFWGLYPYQEDASCDGTSVTMNLPKEQTAVPGTFATNTFPSLGRSQGLIMGFYNICSGMKFSVTKEGIKKVTLKSKGGEKISGKAKVSFKDGIPVAEIIDGSDEVVLEAPAGEYFEPGKYYFLVMFPTKFTNGFTVTLETFTEEAIYERTGSMTANRSRFGTISNIDASATYSKKTGNIPIEDANFKAYLVENFDRNGDGEISYEEATAITSINVITDNIMSAQGIEYMPGLKSLSLCGTSYYSYTGASGKLKVLDVSNNPALTSLSCYNNQLTNLDVSKNTELTGLNCYSNRLVSLDVLKNTMLAKLECGDNQLTTLDVSKNTMLTKLECSDNQLTTLDVSKNTALTRLWCSNNQLTALDVSKNTELTQLHCFGNQLTALDVSKNTELTNLNCNNNRLTSLDVSKNTTLTGLSCGGNQLTALDVSKNTRLTGLSCGGNQLTALDVSKNTELTTISCLDNPLSTLDVSGNTALRILQCGRTQLSALDVSSNIALESLWCPDCLLTTLDLSNNTALKTLQCYKNQLITLDVSKNALLTTLQCSPMNDSNGNNIMTTLYISQGQEIANLQLPYETQIIVAPENGGGEGTGEDDWGDGN